MKLDKFDLALVNAACNDSDTARSVLQCLHFTKGRVEATDSFMLAVRDLDLQEGEEKPEGLINTRMIKQIKPARRQQAILAITGSKATVNYQDDDGSGAPAEFEPSVSFATYGDGKSFPNTDKLWTTAEKKAQIGVNVGLLKKALAMMPNGGILRIGITEPDDPLEFECSNMDRPIRGMIMPMFVSWEKPQWHGKAEPAKKQSGAEVK